MEAADAEKEKADDALEEAKTVFKEAETKLASAKVAKASFYAQQVAMQRVPFADLLPEHARDNAELKELLEKADALVAKLPPPTQPEEASKSAGAAAAVPQADAAGMECDDAAADDIFQEEAASFLMGANEAMDAVAAKRAASDLLGHLQRSKKLRVVQPSR